MKRKQTGFTLIEVLVAVVVLSVGLIGIAGMQTKSLQFNRSAYFHTQATVLTHDMIERMRANPQGLLHEAAYNNPDATENKNCFTLTGCTVTEMAKNDTFEWRQDIINRLPNGRGVVCIDSTPNDGVPSAKACDNTGSQYVVKIWWTNKVNSTQRVVTTVSF